MDHLHIRPKTIKLLEENIGKKLHDIGLRNDFLATIPKAQATKAKTHKWNILTTFHHQGTQLIE